MRVFVFWPKAYWKWIFQWKSLFFWFEVYSKLIFQWECFFFSSQAYWKLIFQWECLFFGLRHCGRRCCAIFEMNFLFLGPELFFNESLCLFGFSTIKDDFQWECFFCRKANWKWIFQWQCLFFGLRPIENGFFNESVCLFGLRHCGRRCCALFSFQFVNFWRPELFL